MSCAAHQRSRASSRGISLLELIIYIGVVTGVLVGIILLLTMLSRGWLRSRARAIVEEDVRLVTERLRAEVESADTIIIPQYQQTVLKDNPVAYWRLDETSGAVAKDISGNAYHGTYGNFTPGDLGQPGAISDGNTAAKFDPNEATNRNYVRVPYNAALNPLAFTVEVWAKPVSAQYGYVVGNLQNGTGDPPPCLSPCQGYRLAWRSTNRWMFSIGAGGTTELTISSSTTTPLNTYAHIVGTYDFNGDKKIRIYINGVLDTTSASAADLIPNTTRDLFFGARTAAGENVFPGLIDEVVVYNRALTAQEIQDHYQNGIGDILELDRTDLEATGTRTYKGFAWSGGDGMPAESKTVCDIAQTCEGIGWISFNCENAPQDVFFGCTQADPALTNYAVTRTLDTLSGFALACPTMGSSCLSTPILFNCASSPNAGACRDADFRVTVGADGEWRGWAWSDQIGWISMNCENTNSCSGPAGDWKVYETQTPTGPEVHGWAWSENYGWISFNCAERSTCGTVRYNVTAGLAGGRKRFTVASGAFTVTAGQASPQSLTGANTLIEKCSGRSSYFRIFVPPPPARPVVQLCFKASYQGTGGAITLYSTESLSTFQLR